MGFLDKLFGRKRDNVSTVERPSEVEVECPHGAVTPRWENAADMGKTELVSAYVCEACGASFSREEGERLMAEAGERLRISEEARHEGMER